jgi:hypothetical protein
MSYSGGFERVVINYGIACHRDELHTYCQDTDKRMFTKCRVTGKFKLRVNLADLL